MQEVQNNTMKKCVIQFHYNKEMQSRTYVNTIALVNSGTH